MGKIEGITLIIAIDFGRIVDLYFVRTLSVQWTIGSGHGAGLCSFSVSSTIDATAFASNTIASGTFALTLSSFILILVPRNPLRCWLIH